MKRPNEKAARKLGEQLLRGLLAGGLACADIAAAAVLAHFLGAWAVCVYLPVEAAALLLAAHIQTTAARGKLAWTAVTLTLPLVGFVLWPLWRPRLAFASVEAPANRTPDRKRSQMDGDRLGDILPDWQRTETLLEKNGFLLYRDTAVTWLPDGEAVFSDALSRISRAERFIFLEAYALRAGKLLDRLLAALDERAGEGVEIKIIADSRGSGFWLDEEKREKLRERGIELQLLGDGATALRRDGSHKDHRRLLCIDGQWAYVGSMDVDDPTASFQRRSVEQEDCAVLLDGLGAWGVTAQFLHMWRKLNGVLQSEDDYYRPLEPRREPGWCQPYGDSPGDGAELSKELFLQCAAGARKSLCLMTGRFAPDETLLQALTTASDGGAAVQLLLPGVWDSRRSRRLAMSSYQRLLQHGVEICTYTPGRIHGQLLLADGEAAMISTGSVEGVSRSHSCGVMLYGMPVIQTIRRDWERLLERSTPVDPVQWAARSRGKRFADRLIRALQ